ncbi:YqgE/AlgH family protein [Neptunicella sp. SCSIO 80796]|uniref:YqgE/AlgH family protein n=1 Tax=Neptunicella plasticusilytica TaxID=3117012 RepID=UPI003A4D9371
MNNSLQNHFLIAMPSMQDPYFSRSLTFICEHNEQGAMGIVLNQPAGMTLKELLKLTNIEGVIDEKKGEHIVVAGGPVSKDRGFILHTPQPGYSASLAVSSDIMVTTSKDILENLANEKSPEKAIVALGYAGWTAGQLEQEIQENSWLVIESDPELLFDVPIHKKWETAVHKLGIDIWQLAPGAGHA